ncbi:protein kinase [Lentzea sp. NPDC051208]|uniref:protein kinase domain-containing protein n=1 Tax=Lentzea sp. NPDC051208 TaxID=3154642 RepID=UPI0034404284
MDEQPLGSNYRLGEQIGAGRMGRVYLGRHVDGREFAVKKLRSDLSDDSGIIARFHQEWAILQKLEGPNLVRVHDLVVEGETVAFVMDLVPGGDLRHVLEATGRLLPSEVARIGAGIARALASAHARGVVHGDVKPENVLMDSSTAERVPKLTDFGIATVVASAGTRTSTSRVGTVEYMAPETAAGGPVSPAVDVYALGVVLYELTCGVTPFASPSIPQTLMGHAQSLPGKPPGITEELWAVIAQLLSKNPLARPDAAVVAGRLDELATILYQRNAPVAEHLVVPPPGRPLGTEAETLLPGALPRSTTPPPARRSIMRKLRVAGAIVVVAAVAATGTYLFASGSTGTSNTGGSGDNAAATSVTVTTTKSTSSAPTSTRVTQLSEMPDLVGKLLGDARDELPASLDLVVEEVFDSTKPDGTVTKQDPEPGGAVGKKVTLTVARPAFTTYLDSLTAASGSWTNSQGEIVGMKDKSYSHSVFARVDGCSSKDSVEYNLNQGYRRFVATAGMSNDSAASGLQVQFEVFADEGRLLTTGKVKLGEVVDFDLDVTKVLRLKIQWQPLRDRETCYTTNAWVLGEAKLLGVAGEVPTSGLPATSTRGSATTTTTTTR